MLVTTVEWSWTYLALSFQTIIYRDDIFPLLYYKTSVDAFVIGMISWAHFKA